LNIVPFTFKGLLTESREIDVKKDNFFAKLEVLNGQTLSDLYLKDPMTILQALKQDTSGFDSSKTYIQEIFEVMP